LTAVEEQQEYQDPLSVFMYALKAPETRRQWPRRLKVFFDFLKLEEPIGAQAKQFLIKTKQNSQWAQDNLLRFMSFQRERVRQGKISEATIPNYYKAVKLFCEMNDLVFNWKKITRGIPRVRQAANDRAPTKEELQSLVQYPDRRIKPIVYTMACSGVRIGAWNYLLWKHVIPMTNTLGEIIAAKLIVYAGDREEYYSFIEAYNKLKRKFDDFGNVDVKSVHTGYFSKMKNVKLMEEDRETFDLIMKDKEKLLSFEEPVQFIFSHSALNEGWDNPNVFNICTLNRTFSNIKKRQELGRGMRLPINQLGERIIPVEHNVLTVIANENYKEYVSKLQQEYVDEYGANVVPPKIANARNRTTLKLKKNQDLNRDFDELWKRLSKLTKYEVTIDSRIFVDQCVNEINNRISVDIINAIRIKVETVSLSFNEHEVIKPIYVGQDHEVLNKDLLVPNILEYLSNETHLTNKTLIQILCRLNNLQLIFNDPQEYILIVTSIIKEQLANFLVDGITYTEVDDPFMMGVFKEVVETYWDDIVKVDKSIYDKGVICDSKVEENFAIGMDEMKQVKVFIKLPDWFIIKTPIGEYNPDWAIVIQPTNEFGDIKRKVYLVIETKGTMDLGNLRPSEYRKIKCAEKHFKSINLDFEVANTAEDLIKLF
jgi:restriction endonuclease